MAPTYRVEIKVEGFYFTPAEYPTKKAGPANDANLAGYVAVLEASTAPGGCNAHLGATVVRSAKIIRQSNGEVVATYTA